MLSLKEDRYFPLSFVIKQAELNEKVVFQKKTSLPSYFFPLILPSCNKHIFFFIWTFRICLVSNELLINKLSNRLLNLMLITIHIIAILLFTIHDFCIVISILFQIANSILVFIFFLFSIFFILTIHTIINKYSYKTHIFTKIAWLRKVNDI